MDNAWFGEIAKHNAALASLINAAGKVGSKGNAAYLTFMARRLMEMWRVLNKTGSIYLHCDPAMSHSLKLVMDALFGHENYRNEIIWHYGGAAKAAKSLFLNTMLFCFMPKAHKTHLTPFGCRQKKLLAGPEKMKNFAIRFGKLIPCLIRRNEKTAPAIQPKNPKRYSRALLRHPPTKAIWC